VASNALNEAQWNSTIIEGDVANFVTELKKRPGKNILKYGSGSLDVAPMESNHSTVTSTSEPVLRYR
jgi:hypothetical protein